MFKKKRLVNPNLIKNTQKQCLVLKNIRTVHGTSRFSYEKGNSSLLWFILMSANALSTIAFVIVIRERYHNDLLVTKINADCQVTQVPFPTVSICNFNVVSLNETRNIAKILRDNNRAKKEVESFFRDLPNLKDFGVRSRNIKNYKDIMKILKDHYFTMDAIMEEIHQKCENLLVYCEFNRKQRACADMFVTILTYEGYCCAFNYAALSDGVDEAALMDGDFEYYYDQSTDEKTYIIGTSQSGRDSGLRVVIDVQPHDYPAWSTAPAYGATVIISDPNDFPETTVLSSPVLAGEAVDLKVDPLVFQSEASVRQVSPDVRGCWFHDEVDLQYTDRYSYETCQTECKMQRYLQNCGCIPYKYPMTHGKTRRTCELADLLCLSNMTAYWSAKKTPCHPLCFLECQDKRYSMTADAVAFLPEFFPSNVTKERNASDLSAVQVYFGKSTCYCYKLSLLIDFNYFIATYGGVFSLSFGGSIITLFEIAYLLMSSLGKVIWSSITYVNYSRKVRKQIL